MGILSFLKAIIMSLVVVAHTVHINSPARPFIFNMMPACMMMLFFGAGFFAFYNTPPNVLKKSIWYLNKFIKLYIPYCVTIILMVVLCELGSSSVWHDLLLIRNFYYGDATDSIFWFIAILGQCFVLLPWIYRFVFEGSFKRATCFVGGFWILTTAAKWLIIVKTEVYVVTFRLSPVNFDNLYYVGIYKFFINYIGIIVVGMYTLRSIREKRRLLPLLGFVVIPPLYYAFETPLLQAVVNQSYVLIVASIMTIFPKNSQLWQKISGYNYSLYLVHPIVIEYISVSANHTRTSDFIVVSVCLICSWIFAILFSRFISPLNLIKKHLSTYLERRDFTTSPLRGRIRANNVE